MIYEYITKNFKKGEPIFIEELPASSRDYLRHELKQLVDAGKLECLCNDVYFIAYQTILGTKGKISVERYIDKKYLNPGGYITGLQLMNIYGFTTQNPSCYEVCSNEATTKKRKQIVDDNTIIVYKPIVRITEKNKSALQFLDLISIIDKYSEITGSELKTELRKYVDNTKVDFLEVKKLLPLYPDKVYRNIYEGGLMCELV